MSSPETGEDLLTTAPRHPLDVRPSGNAFTSTLNLKAAAGYFSLLLDELIILVLEWLDSLSLLNLGYTCKALYAFSRFEDLWKSLLLASPPPSFTWFGTWRTTYFQIPEDRWSKISCGNLYSDVLHRPLLCAHIPLEPYTDNIPDRNQIPRLAELSAIDFAARWSNKPFILVNEVTKWPIYQKWSVETLVEVFAGVKFRAEAVDWSLKTYAEYMRQNSDESPLYLFDRGFVEKMGIRVGKDAGGQYWSPECFGEDLFGILNKQRPDSRWLIIGPKRSGSTFHKDPNATSAWNAVLQGSKYWIMFPASSSLPPPPGVFVSEDQSEVTSPLSIAEWLLGFHADARNTLGCLEGICNAGEVLHVPSGWWHLVVNLSSSIAVTQNFVPEAHLVSTLGFLKNKPDQVSGFDKKVQNPYALFIKRLEERQPKLLSRSLEQLEKQGDSKKRKWDELMKDAAEEEVENNGRTNGFTFGFGGDDESDNDEVLSID